jgi:ATP-binding cassette subfamily B protein
VLDHGGIVDQGTHEELLGRSALYRTLLSGREEDEARAVGDRIEALASVTAGTTTAAAWTGAGQQERTGIFSSRSIGAPSIGPGLGGGGGGAWRANLAPTPELLARVATPRSTSRPNRPAARTSAWPDWSGSSAGPSSPD